MRTRYVTTIPLDHDRLRKDLDQSASFLYSEAYSDYLIGWPWKNATLWSRGGEINDGDITTFDYARSPTFSDYGAQVPYLQELITNTVDTSRLNLVRLARVSHSVIVPHRDFLELGAIDEEVRTTHRLHIPLVTHDECYFSENDTVYRMREGEVWFFDATQVHAVAAFGPIERIHLIFDFTAADTGGPLVTAGDDGLPDGVPADRRIVRPALPDPQRAALHALSPLLTMDTFDEVLALLVKKHFRYDAGAQFVWNTVLALARECPDPAVLPYTEDKHRYFTLERSARSR